MTLRKIIKHLYYGMQGVFPYFGVRVHFPSRSIMFRAACVQGIYEINNMQTLVALARPGTTCLDVGANIGLMAIPILAECSDCCVVSFEPSSNTAPFLRQTVAQSPFSDRWLLVEKALGAQSGQADFMMTEGAGGVYDGLADTRRASGKSIKVEVSTLDVEWRQLRRPDISVVKIDVEGAELEVLAGAQECLQANRPSILLEWNQINFSAYGRKAADLLDYAASMNYLVFSVPGFVPITDLNVLEAQMLGTESFLLKPSGSRNQVRSVFV